MCGSFEFIMEYFSRLFNNRCGKEDTTKYYWGLVWNIFRASGTGNLRKEYKYLGYGGFLMEMEP